MKSWDIRVAVWQGIHTQAGSKFYRGIQVYAAGETEEERVGIASFLNWSKILPDWASAESLMVGQHKVDQMGNDLADHQRYQRQRAWLTTELDRKRKDGYDIPHALTHLLTINSGDLSTARGQLQKLLGSERYGKIEGRIAEVDGAMRRNGFMYGKVVQATAVSAALIASASEASDGWATW